MKKIQTLAILLIILVSCGKPTINGKVKDIFGNPVKDVKVTIEGTSLETFTNSNGEYSSDFVPGKVTVNLSKENFTPKSFTLEIAQKEDYPAMEVEMFELPISQGIYYLNPSNSQYESINKMDFISNTEYLETKRNSFMGTTISSLDVFNSNYTVEINDENITIIRENQVRFIDNDPLPIGLIKLSQLENNSYLIASIEYNNKNADNKVNKYCVLSQNNIKEEIDGQNRPHFILRISNLENGYYAFYSENIQSNLIKEGSLQVFKVDKK